MSNKSIIAFSGRKQSGKNTCVNFIYSKFMVNLGISKKVNIDEFGLIEVSDLMGDKEYSGVFDPTIENVNNDYVLQQVADKMDPVVKIYSFADPLKRDICMNILNLTHNQCYGSDEEKNSMTDISWEGKPLTARNVMQIVGTDILRKMKPDVWTSAIISKISRDKPKLALISDCRFPNEVTSIQENNGVVVRLSRNIHNSEHISERVLDQENYDWDNFDYVIENKELDIYHQSIEVDKILKEVMS